MDITIVIVVAYRCYCYARIAKCL